MAIQRRQFLKIIGSSSVVLAAGVGGFAATREPKRALQPWLQAGNGYQDARMRALSFAILAPNPHNRQPWMVDLSKEGVVTLYCDPERRLPETDPYDRQILIGLGCFLELLNQAAAADGKQLQISLFPQGVAAESERLDHRPIAEIVFLSEQAASYDRLFDQALKRRSSKEPFDMAKAVADNSLARIAGAARDTVAVEYTNNTEHVGLLQSLTWQAYQRECGTPRTFKESVDLMRIGKAEIEQKPDGIDIGGFAMESLQKLGMLSRHQLMDFQSVAYKEGMKSYHELLHATPAYIWLSTSDNSRERQIEAGRSYLRLNQKATELGLAMHPVSQALQEYPEVSSFYQQLHESLGISAPGRVQMLARVGFCQAVSPSPRWPLISRVV